jgi:hypothetical protein
MSLICKLPAPAKRVFTVDHAPPRPRGRTFPLEQLYGPPVEIGPLTYLSDDDLRPELRRRRSPPRWRLTVNGAPIALTTGQLVRVPGSRGFGPRLLDLRIVLAPMSSASWKCILNCLLADLRSRGALDTAARTGAPVRNPISEVISDGTER